jgi:DNA-binding CsgD family transcriptional regulator
LTPSHRYSGALLERERELERVGELLAAARAGVGAVLLITGPAGIGKTSLVDACVQDAGAREIVVLRARGDQLVMESSFQAIRELLWSHVRGAGEQVWDGAARLAAPVFEVQGAGPADTGLTASVLYGLYWLVAGLAERAPLALLVDDAHWLDAASARFLVYLARRIDSLPVLLVIVVRGRQVLDAGSPLAALMGLADSELRVGPLSEEASAALVRVGLGARADEELCRSCHIATGGNPFYLRELTAALAAEPGRPTVEVAKRVRELGAGTVGRTVLIRVAQLGADCERLAQAAAVLGPGCPLRYAAELAALERDRAEVAADALRAADLLTSDRALSFVHPIVSEALTAELPPSRRAALHAQAASLLAANGTGADRVSAHLLSAEPYGQPWVVDMLRAAGREALARGAPEVAIAYLRRAVAEPPAPGSRLGVLVELGRAERLLPEAHDFTALRDALALARDPEQRAEIALELALALFAVIRSNEGRVVLEDALGHKERLSPETVELLEAAMIGGGLDELSATPVLLARAARHFERARRGDVHNPRVLAVLAVTGALTGMVARDVAELARLALADGRLLERWLDDGYVAATYALCATDRLREAASAIDRGIAEARRRGLAPMFMQLAVMRAEAAFRAGDLDTAEVYAERALDLGHELGVEHVALLQWLPIVLIERGRVDAACSVVESVELDDSILGGSFAVVLLAHRGRVRIAAGDFEHGVADLLDADRRMAAVGLQLGAQTDWAPAAALGLVALGRRDEAQQLASRELADATAFGAPRRNGIALSLSGLLSPGDEGLARLRQAVEILRRAGARLEQARALVNLGQGLRERRHPEPARVALTQGMDLAQRCGAGALIERARAELVASGARPRRDALSGPNALTPAEMRTARMAADGLTNREIAQAHFVSTKTVEAQLSQAYAKLSINGRRELAVALSSVPGGAGELNVRA